MHSPRRRGPPRWGPPPARPRPGGLLRARVGPPHARACAPSPGTRRRARTPGQASARPRLSGQARPGASSGSPFGFGGRGRDLGEASSHALSRAPAVPPLAHPMGLELAIAGPPSRTPPPRGPLQPRLPRSRGPTCRRAAVTAGALCKCRGWGDAALPPQLPAPIGLRGAQSCSERTRPSPAPR